MIYNVKVAKTWLLLKINRSITFVSTQILTSYVLYMTRPAMIVANWKMNMRWAEGLALADAVIQRVSPFVSPTLQVVLMPSYLHLAALGARLTSPPRGIQLGAQNCHHAPEGPYTGEVSVPMLHDVGVRYVLVGHSERRRQWDEGPTLLAHKVTAICSHGLQPVFSSGEQQRTTMQSALAIVQQQLADSLFHLSEVAMSQVILAYEPVWAIGTGCTPAPAQVQEMHSGIRETIAQQYGRTLAQQIPILYGGSCNPHNAATFFTYPDVDGGLIGGASLQADAFVKVVEAMHACPRVCLR